MKIFIQEVRSGEFYTGDKGWSCQPDEAYAFSSSIAALNFCQQMEREQPDKQFIMRFERADANRGLRIREGRKFEAPLRA
ncbi:MAG: hypothetical protein H0X66_14595 [Verrucomicrobia bacterium]|nr:hypothetical protein [Verrucomicrobiota bacterium]